jgi:hypothetical protein
MDGGAEPQPGSPELGKVRTAALAAQRSGPELRRTVRAAKNAGKSVREIAHAAGLSIQRVYQILDAD